MIYNEEKKSIEMYTKLKLMLELAAITLKVIIFSMCSKV